MIISKELILVLMEYELLLSIIESTHKDNNLVYRSYTISNVYVFILIISIIWLSVKQWKHNHKHQYHDLIVDKDILEISSYHNNRSIYIEIIQLS